MSEIAQNEGGGGKGASKGRKKASTRVDMTPMVDLGFLLITFFMLTTTLSKQHIMLLPMPNKDKDKPKSESEIKESNAMTVILGENDQIYWYISKNRVPDFHTSSYNPADENGIRKVLLEKTKNPDMNVIIKAMDKSTYKNVIDMIDEIHIVKAEHYALIDITKDDQELVKKQSAVNQSASN
jgi:biopolymer transport protein ExbD